MATAQVFDVIKADALITVQIGTAFYEKLLKALLFNMHGRSEAEMEEAKAQIRAKAITEPWVEVVETMTALCQEIEKQAREQGFVYQKEVGVPLI